MTAIKQHIDVSPEMLSFVGQGALPDCAWPHDCVMLEFALGTGSSAPVLRYEPHPEQAMDESACDVVFVVQRSACHRIFGHAPEVSGTWHMPSSLRALALAIRDCDAQGPARETLMLARSIELLCQCFAEIARGELVPAESGGMLSDLDAQRIAAARRLIDERWQEKLTLEDIARTCGLNRDKLARGFRAIYQGTVAELLAENRLNGARSLLLSTDLPVSTIGYRCGYLNNASFTRAFSRRFGIAPTQLRHGQLAA